MNDQTPPDPQQAKDKLPPLHLDLQGTYPNCFNWKNPRPIKVGTFIDLSKQLNPRLKAEFEESPYTVSKKRLKSYIYYWVSKALRHYCTRRKYLMSLKTGATRIDLDGQPAGTVTEEECRQAEMKLQGIVPLTEFPKPRTPKPKLTSTSQSSASVSEDALPDETPITAENIVSGRLELTIKFSQVPEAIPVKSGFKIGIQTEKMLIVTTLPPKAWKKLQQADSDWPMWVAALTGQYGSQVNTELGPMLMLEKPALQVFEKKPKPPKAPKPPAQPDTTNPSS